LRRNGYDSLISYWHEPFGQVVGAAPPRDAHYGLGEVVDVRAATYPDQDGRFTLHAQS
jgi:hypothetical protein